MSDNVKFPHFRNRGFTFKGNKRQLRLIKSAMRETFGNDITIGKISSLMNNFARVRWKINSLSGMPMGGPDKNEKDAGRKKDESSP